MIYYIFLYLSVLFLLWGVFFTIALLSFGNADDFFIDIALDLFFAVS